MKRLEVLYRTKVKLLEDENRKLKEKINEMELKDHRRKTTWLEDFFMENECESDDLF